MSRKAVLDVVERTGATFAVAFVAAFSFSNLSSWHDVGIAASAAALSALKSTVVNLVRK
jgi:uncharacterized YccA/Bax inhibitor family protein